MRAWFPNLYRYFCREVRKDGALRVKFGMLGRFFSLFVGFFVKTSFAFLTFALD